MWMCFVSKYEVQTYINTPYMFLTVVLLPVSQVVKNKMHIAYFINTYLITRILQLEVHIFQYRPHC